MENKKNPKPEGAGYWNGFQKSIDFAGLFQDSDAYISPSRSASPSSRSSPVDSFKYVQETSKVPVFTECTDGRQHPKWPPGIPCLSNQGDLPPLPPKRWIDYSELTTDDSVASAYVPYGVASTATMPVAEAQDTIGLKKEDTGCKPKQLPNTSKREKKAKKNCKRSKNSGLGAIGDGRAQSGSTTPEGKRPFTMPSQDWISPEKQQETALQGVMPKATPPKGLASCTYVPESPMMRSDIAQASCYLSEATPPKGSASYVPKSLMMRSDIAQASCYLSEATPPKGSASYVPKSPMMRSDISQASCYLSEATPPKGSASYVPKSPMMRSDIAQASCYLTEETPPKGSASYLPKSPMMRSDIGQASCYLSEATPPKGSASFVPQSPMMRSDIGQAPCYLSEATPPNRSASITFMPQSPMMRSDIAQAPCYFQNPQDQEDSSAGIIHEELLQEERSSAKTFVSEYVSYQGWTQEWSQGAADQEMDLQGAAVLKLVPPSDTSVSATIRYVQQSRTLSSIIGETVNPRYFENAQDGSGDASIQEIPGAQDSSADTQAESQSNPPSQEQQQMKRLRFHRRMCLEIQQRELQDLQEQQNQNTLKLPLTERQQRQVLHAQQQHQLLLIQQQQKKEQKNQHHHEHYELMLQQHQEKKNLLQQHQDELQSLREWQLNQDQLLQKEMSNLRCGGSGSSGSSRPRNSN